MRPSEFLEEYYEKKKEHHHHKNLYLKKRL
jgi:hypothetical protein